MDLGKRIIVKGSSGSGKSTLAARLGEITGLPVVHLDALSWNPGWVATPKEKMDELAREEAAKPEWIFDGNYNATIDYRTERADTVIYIDFNRYTCLLRAIRRRIKYHGKTRPDIGEGCPERLSWWLVTWIWGYPKRSRKVELQRLASVKPPKQVFHLKGNKAVRRFLREAEAAYGRTSCGS